MQHTKLASKWISKTEIMSNREDARSIKIDGKRAETIAEYVYLGQKLTFR